MISDQTVLLANVEQLLNNFGTLCILTDFLLVVANFQICDFIYLIFRVGASFNQIGVCMTFANQ